MYTIYKRLVVSTAVIDSFSPTVGWRVIVGIGLGCPVGTPVGGFDGFSVGIPVGANEGRLDGKGEFVG